MTAMVLKSNLGQKSCSSSISAPETEPIEPCIQTELNLDTVFHQASVNRVEILSFNLIGESDHKLEQHTRN